MPAVLIVTETYLRLNPDKCSCITSAVVHPQVENVDRDTGFHEKLITENVCVSVVLGRTRPASHAVIKICRVISASNIANNNNTAVIAKRVL